MQFAVWQGYTAEGKIRVNVGTSTDSSLFGVASQQKVRSMLTLEPVQAVHCLAGPHSRR